MVYRKRKAAVVSDGGRYGTLTSTSRTNRSPPILHNRRISIIRNHIPHKLSPYVGWFRHAPDISSRQICDRNRNSNRNSNRNGNRNHRCLDAKPWNTNLKYFPTFYQEKRSPYVGWFRHAPPSNLYEKKNNVNVSVNVSVNTNVNVNVNTNAKTNVNVNVNIDDNERCNVGYHDDSLRKCCVSGRLPGGSPYQDILGYTGSNINVPSVGEVDKKLNEKCSQSRLPNPTEGYSHSYSKQELDPLNNAKIIDSAAYSDLSSGVLTKFANWFLYPLANDERTSFLTKDNIGEEAILKGMTNGVVTLLPYLSSAFKRFFFIEDGTTKLNLREAIGTTNPCPRDDLSETAVSEYSDYDCPHVHSHVTDLDDDSYDTDTDTDTDHTNKDTGVQLTPPIQAEIHPLHISVSSLAEAYYAEQARQVIVDQYPHSNFNPFASLTLEENQCLDYSISQIDITRMARNASRHLDVESILKLPSITYKTTERDCHGHGHGHSHIDPSTSSVNVAYEDTENSTIDENKKSASNTALNTIEEEDVEMGWSWVSTPENPEGAITPTKNTPDVNLREIDVKEDATEKKEAREEKCIICLEQFGDGDRLRVLPCGHLFHMGCIDKWLSGSFSHHECFTSGCPTCKKTPTIADSEVDAGDRESISDATSDDSVPSWAFANLGGSLAMQI